MVNNVNLIYLNTPQKMPLIATYLNQLLNKKDLLKIL